MVVEATVRLVQDHPYKAKPKQEGQKRRSPGCAKCDGGKHRRQHIGAAPSMNDGGSGMDRMEFQALKGAWQEAFTSELGGAGLPLTAFESAEVVLRFGFRTYQDRDEGNHRWMVEKALGDALVAGKYLVDDTFFPARRFRVIDVVGEHAPDGAFTEALIYFSDDPAPVTPRAGGDAPQTTLAL